MSPVWETAADWDNAQSESGVVHESTTNTDHNDDTIVKQGYAAGTPYQAVDLWAYYPFHEDSGSTANDLSGNGNHATINGATVGATGLLGTTTYSFDGVDDYVETPTQGSLGQAFTLSCWVYPNSFDSNDVIIRKWVTGGSPNEYIFRLENGILNFYIYDGSSHNISGSTLSTATLYYVVAGYDGSTMYLYLDAVQDASSTVNVTRNTGSAPVQIGRRDDNTSFFDGRIFDVRFYSAWLGSSGIQDLYDVVATDGQLTTAVKTL